jgi:ABC-type Zn2+ transport system substrate-binding protein/surface adhesin
MNSDDIFPHVKHAVEDFLFDEEGNIPRNRMLTIGSMMLILSMLLAEPVFAKHRTHYTHRTHSTHSTHSSSTHGSHSTHSTHSTHVTHADHATHVTHGTHSTHANYAPSHSNSGSASIVEDPGNVIPSNPVDDLEGVIEIRHPLTPPDSPSMGR